MERTINGKNITEVMDLFKGPLPNEMIELRDYDNVPYISADNLRERLDEIVGVDHYNEIYSEPVFTFARNTIGISTEGTIEILDDNYEVIFRKSAPGGATITFPKVTKYDEQGQPVKDRDGNDLKVEMETTNSFANDIMSAHQDAFKRICKKFKIGAKQLNAFKEDTVYLMRLKYAIDYSKITSGIFTDTTVDGKQIRLAVFSKSLSTFKAKYPNGVPAGTTLSIVGKEGTDKRGNAQIIFGKFGKDASTVSNTEVSGSPQSQPANTAKNDSNNHSQGNSSKPNTNTAKAGTDEELISISVKTTSKVLQKNKMHLVKSVDESTGELFTLYFDNEGVLKLGDQWKSLVQYSEKGVTLKMTAVKKGSDLLFKGAAS